MINNFDGGLDGQQNLFDAADTSSQFEYEKFNKKYELIGFEIK